MIRTSFVPLALLAGLGTATAQAPSSSAPAPAPIVAPAPAASSAPVAAKGGGLAQKECRSEVDAKPLTGEQRKAEMHSCMQAHRQTCVQSADGQSIPKANGQRRDFVRKCMQGT